MSFKRQYETAREKEIAQQQSAQQSDIAKTVKEVDETMRQNKDIVLDFKQGQEGVDFMYGKDGQVGANDFNEAKFKREIKRELNQLRKKEPEVAEHMAKQLLSNDT